MDSVTSELLTWVVGNLAAFCCKKLLLTWRRAQRFLACSILNQIEKRTGLGPHAGKEKTKQVAVPRHQQKENSMHFSFSFSWNREPGTYNCRLKKRTGLGPHPTLEKPQFWPLFRSMSGVLNLELGGRGFDPHRPYQNCFVLQRVAENLAPFQRVSSKTRLASVSTARRCASPMTCAYFCKVIRESLWRI